MCDGFVGNVTLKAVEGLGRFVKTTMTDAFKNNPLNILGALIARGALKRISTTMNPSNYNGGSLLGFAWNRDQESWQRG